MGGMISGNYTFFDKNVVASSTYQYSNSAVATTVPSLTSGQVDVSGYNYKTLQVNIATMRCASILYRIEGRTSGMSTWGELYSTTVTATPTIDNLLSIGEGVDYMRVGLKGTGIMTATPNSVTIKAFLTELY